MPKAAAKEKAPAKEKKAPAKGKKAPAKEKKETKVKDPNAPKRPLGAYFLFSNDMRAKVKEENPGTLLLPLKDLCRSTQACNIPSAMIVPTRRSPWKRSQQPCSGFRISRLAWPGLGPSSPLEERPARLMGCRKLSMCRLGCVHSKRQQATHVLSHQQHGMCCGTPPASTHLTLPMLHYVIADLKVTEIAKHIGELWKEVGDKEKEKYQKKAADLKVKYEEEMAKYKASGGGADKAEKPAPKAKASKAKAKPEPEPEDDDEDEDGDDGEGDDDDEGSEEAE